jgi:hypothetical protein
MSEGQPKPGANEKGRRKKEEGRMKTSGRILGGGGEAA